MDYAGGFGGVDKGGGIFGGVGPIGHRGFSPQIVFSSALDKVLLRLKNLRQSVEEV
jgi:hypothetical protein